MKKILFCITNYPYSPSESSLPFPPNTPIYMTSSMQNICPILLVLLWNPRKAKFFFPYNYAFPQRVHKAFLFSVPVIESHNKNCYCDKALHMKAEISFESGQCLAMSDCREFTEQNTLQGPQPGPLRSLFLERFSIFSVLLLIILF